MTEITPAIVRELLDYDPITGVFTWRERGLHWFATESSCLRCNSRNSGKRAGRVRTRSRGGYQDREIKLIGRGYSEHRLAWMWMTDEPLPEAIDHENQDATDNRWANLRASSCEHNNRNCSLRRSNTSGVTGVSWNRRSRKWVAHVRVGYILKYLGSFEDIDYAAIAVESFRAENGFDKNHGKRPAPYRA